MPDQTETTCILCQSPLTPLTDQQLENHVPEYDCTFNSFSCVEEATDGCTFSYAICDECTHLVRSVREPDEPIAEDEWYAELPNGWHVIDNSVPVLTARVPAFHAFIHRHTEGGDHYHVEAV